MGVWKLCIMNGKHKSMNNDLLSSVNFTVKVAHGAI